MGCDFFQIKFDAHEQIAFGFFKRSPNSTEIEAGAETCINFLEGEHDDFNLQDLFAQKVCMTIGVAISGIVILYLILGRFGVVKHMNQQSACLSVLSFFAVILQAVALNFDSHAICYKSMWSEASYPPFRDFSECSVGRSHICGVIGTVMIAVVGIILMCNACLTKTKEKYEKEATNRSSSAIGNVSRRINDEESGTDPLSALASSQSNSDKSLNQSRSIMSTPTHTSLGPNTSGSVSIADIQVLPGGTDNNTPSPATFRVMEIDILTDGENINARSIDNVADDPVTSFTDAGIVSDSITPEKFTDNPVDRFSDAGSADGQVFLTPMSSPVMSPAMSDVRSTIRGGNESFAEDDRPVRGGYDSFAEDDLSVEEPGIGPRDDDLSLEPESVGRSFDDMSF